MNVVSGTPDPPSLFQHPFYVMKERDTSDPCVKGRRVGEIGSYFPRYYIGSENEISQVGGSEP